MAPARWIRGPTIGHGSTATVFLATSSSTGDVFAVKSAELCRSDLLRREQSILSSLCCPSVIACHGFEVSTGDSGDSAFYNLFLEYAHGGSLADRIKRSGGCLKEAEVRVMARGILAGLAYLHSLGIVHCDVKPANVLIDSEGRAKIGDLGCARWLAASERVIRGSPMYMSPEAVRGEEQGTPADVWALGCTMIEMVTGRPPWTEISDAVAAINRIGLSGDVPEIPAWLSEEARNFLGKCLRLEPEERWTTEDLLRHPFVAASDCAEESWVSPKSTLDLRFWEAIEELEEKEMEEGNEFRDEESAGSIRNLAAVSGSPNWDWCGGWLVVREENGEIPAEKFVEETGSTECGQCVWRTASTDRWVPAANP
ncbi:hypothetical protein HPP92_005295 [Vanilla planifolia]|uniref:Protein kinase domain-containing protein n=1 Tax=Vanilla planifolia TaxID=51239 RepID=A0A835RU55_VANPL|nr:hypothetical protein HPP92_005295 [Vanilla planifolia]